MIPFVENLQSGYHSAGNLARTKAHALAQLSPRSMRLLVNRYALFSLAAGACLFAVSRLRRWRNGHAHASPARSTRRTASKSRAPRKHVRRATREAKTH